MWSFGGGMPPPKHPKHSFYGIAHAPQGILQLPCSNLATRSGDYEEPASSLEYIADNLSGDHQLH